MTPLTQHDEIGVDLSTTPLIGSMMDVQLPTTVAQLTGVTGALQRQVTAALPMRGPQILAIWHRPERQSICTFVRHPASFSCSSVRSGDPELLIRIISDERFDRVAHREPLLQVRADGNEFLEAPAVLFLHVLDVLVFVFQGHDDIRVCGS